MTRGRSSGTVMPGSLTSQLIRFFASNPDEELTVELAAQKFEATKHAVQMAVGRLALRGELEHLRVIRLPAKGRAS